MHEYLNVNHSSQVLESIVSAVKPDEIDSKSEEILIRKGSEENRTHFIHVMEIKSKRYINAIKFRDILNSNKDILDKYQNLKRELASKYQDNREMYTKSKAEFINKVLKENKKES